jgi:hypothetical protein
MSEQPPDRIWSGIDIFKLVAGTLAAVSAAIVGSFLGVAGTLVGAAVASLIGTVGTEVYARSLNRGYSRLRHTYAGGPVARDPAPDTAPATTTGALYPGRGPRWKRIALATAAVFVLAMSAVSAVELLAGRSFSSLFGNDSGGGTTISSVGRKAAPEPKPARTPAPTVTTPSASPSATTAAPTTGPSAQQPAPTTSPTAQPTTGAPAPAPTPTP